jgi:hypothetical protein
LKSTLFAFVWTKELASCRADAWLLYSGLEFFDPFSKNRVGIQQQNRSLVEQPNTLICRRRKARVIAISN